LLISAAVAVAVAFAYFLIRDLGLSNNILDGNLPDIVVERLDFARVIKGKEWRVKALDAESGSGMIKARSLDINVVEIATKRSSHIYASQGEYATATYKMWLRDVDGVAYLGDRSVDFTAPRADYDSSADVWFFSEGVSANDGSVFVTGRFGRIGSDGVIILGKGARVRWNIK
jgi:hypothetical protein